MSRSTGTGFPQPFLLLVFFLQMICSAAAQEPTAPLASQQPPPTQQEKPGQNSGESKPETKITPQQAEQLFRDVDTILDFASKDSALPIKHEVKRRLASRD